MRRLKASFPYAGIGLHLPGGADAGSPGQVFQRPFFSQVKNKRKVNSLLPAAPPCPFDAPHAAAQAKDRSRSRTEGCLSVSEGRQVSGRQSPELQGPVRRTIMQVHGPARSGQHGRHVLLFSVNFGQRRTLRGQKRRQNF